MLLAAVISRSHLCARSTVGIVILAASSTLNAHPITARDFCRPQLIEGWGLFEKRDIRDFWSTLKKLRRPEGSIAVKDYLAGLTAREANQVNLNPEFAPASQSSSRSHPFGLADQQDRKGQSLDAVAVTVSTTTPE